MRQFKRLHFCHYWKALSGNATIETSHFQGKGKKRAVGWFPASYVKLLAGGEAASGAAASDTSGAAANSAGGEIGDYVLMWVGAMT